jgi:hypothetical protein
MKALIRKTRDTTLIQADRILLSRHVFENVLDCVAYYVEDEVKETIFYMYWRHVDAQLLEQTRKIENDLG